MTDRLDIFDKRDGTFYLAWTCDGEEGAVIGAPRPGTTDAEELAIANAVRPLAYRVSTPFQEYEFDTKSTALKALRAARAAIKSVKSATPWPDWALTASANGWKPPKGWKP